MEEKLKKVMSSVFGIELSAVHADSSPETIEEWDSLKHVLLVIALEKEFKVKFTPKEILALLSYKQILAIMQAKIRS
jgi:acyl carrier protein